MLVAEAKELLEEIDNLNVNVRISIKADSGDIANSFLKFIKSLGYNVYVEKTAYSDYEIVVTSKHE